MEGELTCAKCSKLLREPLSLPCSHSVCHACAEACTVQTATPEKTHRRRDLSSVSTTTNQNVPDLSDCQSDDSGYLSMMEIHACLHQQLQGPIKSIKCPKCDVSFILDDRGINCLPRNFIIEHLVQKLELQNAEIFCQLCEKVPPVKATLMCEQCRVSYCDKCLAICHPRRGPLMSHSLVSPKVGVIVNSKPKAVLKCTEHRDENISMYCALCKMPVCYLCFEEGRHSGHEAKALGTVFKEQKIEMAKDVNVLKQKNKELQEFVQQLTSHDCKLQENAVDFESRVVAQIDEVITYLEKRKSELISSLSTQVSQKSSQVCSQRERCSNEYNSTSGLLYYAEEVLKESDPATYLLVSSSLCTRLSYTIETWIGKQGLHPVVTSDTELALSTDKIIEEISKLNFHKAVTKKKFSKPTAPQFISDQCSVLNNTLTLEWKIDLPDTSAHFILDVDDGLGGKFQEVHRTDETVCTLGGLQFCSTYRARVRSTNSVGESDYSEIIYLTTPQVAHFKLDKELSHKDIVMSNEQQTMKCLSFENRVALGDVGFSRGRHYWEVTIDKYEGNPDPAIGIAQEDCIKDAILGKDSKSWSVYVDSTRSWFQHNNAHLFRSEGGIEAGSTIGLLLDLDQCLLTFYCNEEKHGPIEFPSLQNVDMVYPAFSLNRNVVMTIHTGILPPDST